MTLKVCQILNFINIGHLFSNLQNQEIDASLAFYRVITMQ